MRSILFAALLSFIFIVPALSQEKADLENEKDAVQKVITSAYQEGISNKGDAAAIRKGFHPGFNIIGMNKNNSIWKYPIYSWIESVEQKLKDGKYPPEEKITFKYPLIDITENAAMAKVLYFKGSKHVYTDYLSLYKFKEGWRIVNKIYYQHEENK